MRKINFQKVGRLSLANLPTPIQRLPHTSRALGKNIYIWRDDLTGFIESGNKVRKLEFLLADALSRGCDSIVTCGGPQSNHARATAVLARKLGLDVSIVTCLPKQGLDPDRAPEGNRLINEIFGAQTLFVPTDEF